MADQRNNIFEQLNQKISGDAYWDPVRVYMLSTDASIYRREPAAVVYPRSNRDVISTVEFAAANGLSIHSRGAGSGLCGSAIGTGIVIDFTRYLNRLIKIDVDEGYFECEPGYRFGELEAALTGTGLFFPPAPSSGEYASFGGMYGTNASGAQSVKYGNVADYILDAEVVFSSGEMLALSDILARPFDGLPGNLKNLYTLYTGQSQKIESSYPPIRYNSTGYNLRELVKKDRLDLTRLFAGSEGTLGIVTRLKFRLAPKPSHDSLIVAGFDDIVSSAIAVQKILPMGPSGIEILEKSLLQLVRNTDPGLKDKIPGDVDNILLIEFDGFDSGVCSRQAQEVRQLLEAEGLSGNIRIAVSDDEKARLWHIRKAAMPILYKLKGSKRILPLIEDAAVPTDQLVPYVEGLTTLLSGHQLDFIIYGHIAKGLLHTRPLLNLKDPADVKLLKPLADSVFELVHSLGGAISGEHGDGRIRSAYIKKQYPEIYDLFLETKRLLDGKNLFNPEIITAHDEYQVEKHLRFGKGYEVKDIADEALSWPEGLSREIEKCHGCSKCTTITTATRMCPIYKFTRDEAAAPKAKANILRGLISGEIKDRELYEKAFQHVIEQCVNCGSCFAECPSNVNIPKMAIEARAQYVRRFGPSLENRLVVNAELAGRTTRKFSGAIKKLMDLKPAKQMGQYITGISARRDFPAFESKSLFERIEPQEGRGSPRILYFAGCYSSYLKPQIGQSAVAVLKSMGMTVVTPPQHCCGLPMLSKGMIKEAAAKIRQNQDKWQAVVNTVDHIVVTCSSCGFALMEDWQSLLENEFTAGVKDKITHISSLLNNYFDRLDFKTCDTGVSYHAPCHLKIQDDPNSSIRLLSRIQGLALQDLKSHCCGMIGSWGLSADHFDLSKQIGSDMIAKLNQSAAAVGATDCPTCRMQMEQFSDKEIKHPIEIVYDCLRTRVK
ncbi:MAG: anaerobic glycerol-3-phosphate dehydrogenase subunit C [Deltaproteobacteria bacterium]|nr:anaerobic glycerol-3-phosphate dehydrogenase subunit C [Deltaproteobacteria bacterium]